MRCALALVAAGCAAAPAVPAARFANAPIVWVVDDRHDVAKLPSVYTDYQDLDGWDAEVEEPLVRALELPTPRRALGVNAVDEVPDSTWFTNRIGVRALTPDEIYNGPLVQPSPELFKPWTVREGKPGGGGLIVVDTRGERYLVKLDEEAFPELESATHVIVNRLLWACGYNVPEDQIVSFTLDDLVIAPGANQRERAGGASAPLTREALQQLLAHVARAPDGRIRALASRWLDGKPIGGPARTGVRAGDPNDRIPHELRRDLRGEYPILAWVSHVDVARGNFLDMWVSDPRDRHHHYVRHYEIDFGRSLGAMGAIRHDLSYGHHYELDYADVLRRFVLLGLAGHSYGETGPGLRGVAAGFTADELDPGAWHSDVPFTPFVAADRFDKAWGARIMSRFTRAQIRAAVDAAKLSDPRAARYLTDTLVARQRATLAYWFARVAPIDRVEITGERDATLCFDDLALTTAITAPGTTRYAFARFGRDGARLGPGTVAWATPGGTTCTTVPLAAGGDGYTIVEITTRRPGFSGKTYIHVARDPIAGAPRLVGIYRI
ncbi:MAG TPA: hypothetical protein VLX92_11655 [Kofleriaceae bacterium]|nr:hypothetical protein [Kofleriaceae bacterium]